MDPDVSSARDVVDVVRIHLMRKRGRERRARASGGTDGHMCADLCANMEGRARVCVCMCVCVCVCVCVCEGTCRNRVMAVMGLWGQKHASAKPPPHIKASAGFDLARVFILPLSSLSPLALPAGGRGQGSPPDQGPVRREKTGACFYMGGGCRHLTPQVDTPLGIYPPGYLPPLYLSWVRRG